MLYREVEMFDDVAYIHPITKKKIVGKVIERNKDTEELLCVVEGSRANWFKAHDLVKG